MFALSSILSLDQLIRNYIFKNDERYIKADILQTVLLHIIYTLKELALLPPAKPFEITADDLDENNSFILNHGLETDIPIIGYINEYNQLVGEAWSTIDYIDNMSVTITPNKTLQEGEKIRGVAFKIISTTEQQPEIEYIRTIIEQFLLWEGFHPNENPVGWVVSTDNAGGFTTSHYVKQQGGSTGASFTNAAVFYSNLPYQLNGNYLKITTEVYLLNNTNYKISFDYYQPAHGDIAIDFFNNDTDGFQTFITSTSADDEHHVEINFTTGNIQPENSTPFFMRVRKSNLTGDYFHLEIANLKVEIVE